jgi:hypothetical protein
MPALFPNSAAAESYKIGQQVRWYVNSRDISPYIGRVTEICPGINKVWVEWPVGGNTQMDPTDLIIVTAESYGISPIDKETGYGSSDKEKSKKTFGEIHPRSTIRLAQKIAAKEAGMAPEECRMAVAAEEIASKFASDVVDKISSDILSCKNNKFTDVQAYCEIYPKYENICSDHLMRFAISKIYEE